MSGKAAEDDDDDEDEDEDEDEDDVDKELEDELAAFFDDSLAGDEDVMNAVERLRAMMEAAALKGLEPWDAMIAEKAEQHSKSSGETAAAAALAASDAGMHATISAEPLSTSGVTRVVGRDVQR